MSGRKKGSKRERLSAVETARRKENQKAEERTTNKTLASFLAG
jgi:hypothetical protein